MKDAILLSLFAVFIFTSSIYAQNCLPEGIEFYSQTEIDNFPSNYPGCSEVDGDVLIMYGANINNLDSLYPLNKINGNIWIYYQPELTSLSGLHNVDTIHGELDITGNVGLSSLEGLESLSFIGESLFVMLNENMNSLVGVENLQNIGFGLFILINNNLTDIAALENTDLSNIDYLYIYRNSILSECNILSICSFLEEPTATVNIYLNASGCNNTAEISNACSIPSPCLPYGNYFFYSQEEIDSFTSDYPSCSILNGYVRIRYAENLNGLLSVEGINGDLIISQSNSLQNLSGLDNIEYINGNLDISGTGLVDIEAISTLESDSLDLLRISNNALLSECSINSICTYFDNENGAIEVFDNAIGCNNPVEIADSCNLDFDCLINGNYYFIHQEQIDDFSTLYPLCTELQGDLFIEGDEITNLDGLSQIVSISGDLTLQTCYNLFDFSGLLNINTVGGRIYLLLNPNLENLDFFENLTSVNNIRIASNYALTDIYGLENISADSLIDLNIYGNTMLSNCAITSICEYLELDSSLAIIYGNATNCNSREEVEESCIGVSIDEITNDSYLKIYPNPVNDLLHIQLESEFEIEEIKIFNQLGQATLIIKKNKNTIDVSKLNDGNYIIEVITKETVFRRKFIKN